MRGGGEKATPPGTQKLGGKSNWWLSGRVSDRWHRNTSCHQTRRTKRRSLPGPTNRADNCEGYRQSIGLIPRSQASSKPAAVVRNCVGRSRRLPPRRILLAPHGLITTLPSTNNLAKITLSARIRRIIPARKADFVHSHDGFALPRIH